MISLRLRRLGGTALLVVWMVAVQTAVAADPALRIVYGAHKQPVAIEAAGLAESRLREFSNRPSDDDAFAGLLAVHVADDEPVADRPGMLGTYSVEQGVVRFTPRYPLRPGMKYRALLHPLGSGESKDLVGLQFDGPAPRSAQPAEVSQVYPTAGVLPENQLKFYIHFSAPMSRGEAYQHVRLLRADDSPIDVPFLELGEELWDASGRRLTLLIDPGRIKQGLKPREEAGPVLEADREYTLAIDAGWNDADGRPLARDYRKTFKTSEPIAKAIDPAQWQIAPPRAWTEAPLAIRFPRPLDRALLERTLTLVGRDGRPLDGRVAISREETLWEFHPARPLPTGKYRLVVDTVLEDLAGNRIGQAFEIEQTEDPAPRGRPESVTIPIEVTPGG